MHQFVSVQLHVQLCSVLLQKQCHTARLREEVPAHQAVRTHVHLSLGHLSVHNWKHRPGRLNNRWVHQIRNDTATCPRRYGDQQFSMAMAQESRNGPRRLCKDDDAIMCQCSDISSPHVSRYMSHQRI